ncbi:putative cytochrome P450 monooxygenase [Rosellinia necatrix]|uniref:Putative cytochrome P450 monooxygenase n=1 Tax=Rosellinia necatrix TaxID=77044 RepID=A0A1W2TVH0_ROSNE|nr:putative cytochrome P450 monooxygenase [Rosellinia necatrix]
MAPPSPAGLTVGSAALWVVPIAVVLYLAYLWALPKPIPGIPYDESAKNNLFGNMPEMVAMLRATGRTRPFFTEHSRRHQSALTQIWPGPLSKPALVLADFRETQDILLRRTREFDRGPLGTVPFTTVVPNNHVSMASSDPRFKGNKDLIKDLMTPNFLHEVSAPQIYTKTMALIELWTLKAELGGGRAFNARGDIFDAAVDIINAVAFGLDDDRSTVKNQISTLRASGPGFKPAANADGSVEFPALPMPADLAAMQEVVVYLGEQFKVPFPRLTHRVKMLTDRALVRNIARKDRFIRDEIDRAAARLRRGEGGTRSAMDHILQREISAAEKAGRAPVFHSPQIHDELFGYLVAGHDTSSTALSWMVKNLAEYPETQAKLRSALRGAYAAALGEGRQPSVTELWKTQVPYLDAFLEESLRFDGPVPVLVREALVDTEVLGHRVPRGTAVFMISDGPDYLTPAIRIPEADRSPSARGKQLVGSWDPADIHLFNPERWLKTTDGAVAYDSQSGPMLAFSVGPRGCFGRRLAYLEVRVVLALLVWNFEFHPVPGALGTREAYDALTKNPRRCYVSLTKIT